MSGMGAGSEREDESQVDLRAGQVGAHVVGQPDAALVEEQGGADGRFLEDLLREEVLLYHAQPDDVALGEPVQRYERVVVALAVPAVSVDREVGVTLQEDGDVSGQGLGQPEAGDGAHAAVLGQPGPCQHLQVGLRCKGELRSDIPKDHGVATYTGHGSNVRVDGTSDALAYLEGGEVATHDQEDLSVGFDFLAVGEKGQVCQAQGQEQGNEA